MCWNAEVSLNTFLFGLFSVGLGIINHVISPLQGIYYMSFISMQLVEHFAWKNLDNKERIALLSKIGLFLIVIQPFLKILSTSSMKKEKLFFLIAYLIHASYLVWYVNTYLTYNMSKAKNGHLTWDWLILPKWIVLVWVGFLIIPYLYTKDYLWLIITILLFALVYITYVKTHTWASLWCWIISLLSIILLYNVFAKDLCTLPGKN